MTTTRYGASALALACLTILLSACTTTASRSDTPAQGTAGFGARTEGMTRHAGFIPFYSDPASGRIFLEITAIGAEFIYVSYLARGVGSNDLGLDRGQLGATRIVRFQRAGPRVLMVEPNYDYRAISDSSTEQRAVAESFASSVLWSFKVEAQAGDRLLVDATAFLARDAHGLSRRLADAGEGSYSVDPDRSAFYPERSRAFPRNTELEFMVTFSGDPRGMHVPRVTPTAEAITVHMHHSFVALPDDGYTPRVFDPRSGYFGISYQDYAAPIDAPLTRRFIVRHRLQKRDPAAAVSEAVEPLTYYVDPGAPSPVREALIDGARWWTEAFEAIGYRDAFRVEVLPEDADPLDVRYNVIQWVHRSTRGWSYGASVIDPRTGEIIKGHVSLGSLRVRQDLLLAEGFTAPYRERSDTPAALKEMALARLRQLSAHEVGHTLGLNHNFAASVQDRASVMDYPHPLVTLDASGRPDLARAYDTGIGAWDRFAIEYGYRDFPPGTEESAALADIVARSLARGQLYMVDADARVAGAAHPLAHLWDNGEDAVTELRRIMTVRAAVLARFSTDNIPAGTPLAVLEEVLVPMYLMHRYQADAAAKLIGGQLYTYAVKGDGQLPVTPVAPAAQRAALGALLDTLAPDALTLPYRLTGLIPARPPGFPLHRETFPRRTGPVFDVLAPAETASAMIIGLVLQPQRANRLVNQHALDVQQPGLGEVIDTVLARSWRAGSSPVGATHKLVDHAVLDGMMRLAVDTDTSPLARETVTARLEGLATYLTERGARGEDGDHYRFARLRIQRFLDDPEKHPPPPAPELPPGSPIGQWLN